MSKSAGRRPKTKKILENPQDSAMQPPAARLYTARCEDPMAKMRLGALLHRLFRKACPEATLEVPDGELLERFARQRDQAAFELLLWRHGPMVLSLCQRLIHNEADCEDAFQATFLTLVRKAGSIAKRDSLPSWLYKVAYRIACRLRVPARVGSGMARVHAPELIEDRSSPDAQAEAMWRDLCATLDQELSKLPESYRRAVILC